MIKRPFWLLLFLTMHVSSFANECKVINAVCSPNWYPVSFLSSKNEAKGVAIEVTRALAKELQLNIEYNCNLPWARANLYMDSSKVDMLVGHYSNLERKQNWVISNTLFFDDIRAVYLDSTIKINNVDDLKELVGVKPRGASFGSAIDEQISEKTVGFKVHEVANKGAMISQLLRGRVDYILTDKDDILQDVKMLDLADELNFSESLALVSVHFSFSKLSPCTKYLAQFNALIEDYRASGFIDELFVQLSIDKLNN